MINGITFNEEGYEWSMTPPKGTEYQCVYIYQTPEAENKKLKKQLEEMKKKMTLTLHENSRLRAMEEQHERFMKTHPMSLLNDDNEWMAKNLAPYIDREDDDIPKPDETNVVFDDGDRGELAEYISENIHDEMWNLEEEWYRDNAERWIWDAKIKKYRMKTDDDE